MLSFAARRPHAPPNDHLARKPARCRRAPESARRCAGPRSGNGEAVSAKASELASTSTNGDGPSHDAEQFFREYAGGIYRYCVRRLGSPEEAEDALQVVYLNAWRAMKRGTIPRTDRKSTRLNSSHSLLSRMPSSA